MMTKEQLEIELRKNFPDIRDIVYLPCSDAKFYVCFKCESASRSTLFLKYKDGQYTLSHSVQLSDEESHRVTYTDTGESIAECLEKKVEKIKKLYTIMSDLEKQIEDLLTYDD